MSLRSSAREELGKDTYTWLAPQKLIDLLDVVDEIREFLVEDCALVSMDVPVGSFSAEARALVQAIDRVTL